MRLSGIILYCFCAEIMQQYVISLRILDAFLNLKNLHDKKGFYISKNILLCKILHVKNI